MPRRTRDDVDRWLSEDIDIATRTIYVGPRGDNSDDTPEINAWTAAQTIKNLHVLSSGYNKEERIRLILCTPGGHVDYGFAIYDSIQAAKHTCDVDIYVVGHAESMGSVILQAGSNRYLLPNSAVMVHDGDIKYEGSHNSGMAYAIFNDRLKDRTHRIYSQSSGRPIEFWALKCRSDYYLTADEAVELGLADEIVQNFD